MDPFSRIEPIQTMSDGTIKQVNPFSGTEVWTVPGRGHRPMALPADNSRPLEPGERDRYCAFCFERMLETPPEKSRISYDGQLMPGLGAAELTSVRPAFRRVPNLFEILPFSYWKANYDYYPDAHTQERMARYLADPAGRDHVLTIMRRKLEAAQQPSALPEEELLALAVSFFASTHDVIIADRHFISDATTTGHIASAGTLTPWEHEQLFRLVNDATADLYARNRYASYVVVFQNWLAAAGASFEHLHKQLVAVDDRGMNAQRESTMLRNHPNMYNEWAVDYANKRNLIIAENEHAVLFAGFGHRFPTLEIFSKSEVCFPWQQSPAEVRGMSDMVHAAHVAVGPDIASNEEWHHSPPGAAVASPWRILIKLRISTLAGFEGGTKIYLNTISPWDLRDKVVDDLFAARAAGKIAAGIAIATEAQVAPNSLRYSQHRP